MRTEIGRFFDGHLLETVRLLKALYDVATGAGQDVEVSLEGREMVFVRRDSPGRGFLRVTPLPTSALVAFPRGRELFDPEKRFKGPPGSETRLLLARASDIDVYVRRLMDAAYALDQPAQDDFWF